MFLGVYLTFPKHHLRPWHSLFVVSILDFVAPASRTIPLPGGRVYGRCADMVVLCFFAMTKDG